MSKVLLEDDSLLSQMSNFISTVSNKEFSKLKNPNKPSQAYLNGSISNYSKNLIMTFPVLCDNSLPPSTASMISRANERNIISMLRMLFAAAQFQAGNGMEVLSQIHKNISISKSFDDYMDALDTYAYGESVTPVELRRTEDKMRSVLKISQSPSSFPVNSFSEHAVSEYTVFNVNGNNMVKLTEGNNDDYKKYLNYLDNQIKDPHNLTSISTSSDTTVSPSGVSTKQTMSSNIPSPFEIEKLRNEVLAKRIFIDKTMQDIEFDKKDDERKGNEEKRKQAAEIRNQAKFDQDMKIAKADQARKDSIEDRQKQQFQNDFLAKQLLDTDVKKCNEMSPALMIVNFNMTSPDGRVETKSFVAGVKSRLISVDSSDIVERLIVKRKTNVSFLNLIRATTGEIRFVKDFLLCIDQAKIDAKNNVKKGEAARMFKILEKRSSKNSYNKIKRQSNDASSITSLVINQETVNILKKEYNFDIERVANARMIMDAYNLLAIIIADESIDVCKFLYDGYDTFEQQAYSYLEKEAKDTSYKQVINLMNKMGGR